MAERQTDTADQDAGGREFLARPERPPDTEPRSIHGLDPGAPREEQQAQEPEQPEAENVTEAPPERLDPDAVLERLNRRRLEAARNEDPVRAEALAEATAEAEMNRGLSDGAPIAAEVQAEQRYQDGLRELVATHPGIDSEEFSDEAEAHLDRIASRFGEAFAYSAEALSHLYRELGGEPRWDPRLTTEEAMFATALGFKDRRTTDRHGREVIEAQPRGRKVDRFGFG